MARYYRRRFYRPKKKYNIENKTIHAVVPVNQENGYYQNQIRIVAPSTTEGVRKVTRFTITLTATDTLGPIYWALVYIPEGAVTSSLFPVMGELFQPSNYVLASGVSEPNAGPIRISSRIQKNLNANDQIYLMTAATNQPHEFNTAFIHGLVRYAITYN